MVCLTLLKKCSRGLPYIVKEVFPWVALHSKRGFPVGCLTLLKKCSRGLPYIVKELFASAVYIVEELFPWIALHS